MKRTRPKIETLAPTKKNHFTPRRRRSKPRQFHYRFLFCLLSSDFAFRPLSSAQNHPNKSHSFYITPQVQNQQRVRYSLVQTQKSEEKRCCFAPQNQKKRSSFGQFNYCAPF